MIPVKIHLIGGPCDGETREASEPFAVGQVFRVIDRAHCEIKAKQWHPNAAYATAAALPDIRYVCTQNLTLGAQECLWEPIYRR